MNMMQLGRKAEILLVEDNRGDELLAYRAFHGGPIDSNFSVADTAEDAWAMLKRQGEYVRHPMPDLILLDLNLPRMSGKGLLVLIKGDADLKHIPVIVMTSSEASSDVKRCYDLHANGYMIKPIDLDSFKDAVTIIEKYFFGLVLLAPEMH